MDLNKKILHACPNCGGRWEQISVSDYEYACDTCCMRIVDGVLISRDCECEDHEKGFNYLVERDGNLLNIVEEALFQLKEQYGVSPKEREGFDALPIVEKLLHRNLITWDMYHLFISEERSLGSIPCCMVDGKFEFPFIDCSKFDSANLPKEPEDEMYFHIYSVVNGLINKKR